MSMWQWWRWDSNDELELLYSSLHDDEELRVEPSPFAHYRSHPDSDETALCDANSGELKNI